MDFVQAVNDSTSGRGVDVILDIIGGNYLERNIECLATDGRLAQIGLQGGAKTEINLSKLMYKRLTLTGSTLRIRSVAQKGAIAREVETHVFPLIASGQVAPVIHGTLPLSHAADAHRLLEMGTVIGKLVLTIGS
jgi:NADPH:quinone reductase-like Zn-dependent oxidoreductase